MADKYKLYLWINDTYSYTKLYSQANNDPKLTGSKKQKLLNKYSKLIKMYSNKLKKEQVKNGR